MKLGVAERFLLLELLGSEQGNIATAGILRKLCEKIEFTAEEFADFGIIVDTEAGRVNWKIGPPGADEANINLTPRQVEFVAKIFRKAKNLKPKHVPLAEKFGIEFPDGEEE